MNKAVFFTGHRPPKLGGYDTPAYYDTHTKVTKFLQETIAVWARGGINTWITGMAQGIDQIAASAVASMKSKGWGQDLRLIAALPYPSQADRWWGASHVTYKQLLQNCDEIYVVHSDPIQGQRGDAAKKLDDRNHFMVDFPNVGVCPAASMEFGRKYPDLENKIMLSTSEAEVVAGIAFNVDPGGRGGTNNCIKYATLQGVKMLTVNPLNTNEWSW